MNSCITLYYADWCGHCQAFKQIWKDIKKQIDDFNAKNEHKIKYEEYEATTQKEEVDKAGVQGFPTIMISHQGKISEYQGPRTVKDIMSKLGGKGGCSCINQTIEGDIYYPKYLKYKQKYLNLKNKSRK
jgi:glutaredoxin